MRTLRSQSDPFIVGRRVTLCNSQILPELPVFTSRMTELSKPLGFFPVARHLLHGPISTGIIRVARSKWLSSDPEKHSMDRLARREKGDALARFLLRKANYHRKALVRQATQD